MRTSYQAFWEFPRWSEQLGLGTCEYKWCSGPRATSLHWWQLSQRNNSCIGLWSLAIDLEKMHVWMRCASIGSRGFKGQVMTLKLRKMWQRKWRGSIKKQGRGSQIRNKKLQERTCNHVEHKLRLINLKGCLCCLLTQADITAISKMTMDK